MTLCTTGDIVAEMNWLDIVIIVILAVSIFTGLRAGIIKAALSLAGLIAGVLLAGHYHIAFSERLSFISAPTVAKIVAFAIILIGVMIIAAILARLLNWAISAVMLGWVNRIGGAIFGLVMGAIFCGALLAIWIKYSGINATITESTLATILLDRLPIVLGLLPDEFETIRSFFQQ